MERKFEVGDKVRFAHRTSEYAQHGLLDEDYGEVGEVVQVDVGDDDYPYGVAFDKTWNRWWFAEVDIEQALLKPHRIDPTIITRLNEVVTMLREQASMTSTPDKHAGIIARIDAVNVAIDELSKEER